MFSGEVLKADVIGHEDDPYTYNEVMEDIDANMWKKAMNIEMESMGSNRWVKSKGSKRRKFACC